MEFIKQYWKKALFAILLLSLFIPLTVKTFNLFSEEPLGGVTIETEKPILNDSTWFQGLYQEQQEKYINENMGMHNTLIRLNNQINFSLYKKTSAKKVVIGKENYIFENNYISATTGADFVGNDKINSLTNQAKECQDILDNMSIKLLFVFAPGKATYFSEYIPDQFLTDDNNITTNYHELVESCQTKGLNFIDFNSWFLKMKDTTSYPLFPKAGIHWTTYGMYLSADSIIKKIESDISKDIPELLLSDIEISEEQRGNEYDLGNLLNLLYPIKTYELAYPKFGYKQTDRYRPKVLVIGDSFYWSLYYSGIPSNIFNCLEFWYYSSKYYNDGTDKPQAEVKDIDILSEISKFEYIIILQTDGGLNNFGFGFFNKIIKAQNNPDKTSDIQEYIDKISNDPKWMIQIKEKAKQRRISVEEMIEIDAEYMYNQDNEISTQ